jgi:hypothetical protein
MRLLIDRVADTMIADRRGLTAYLYTRKNVTEALSMTSSGASEKQAVGKTRETVNSVIEY